MEDPKRTSLTPTDEALVSLVDFQRVQEKLRRTQKRLERVRRERSLIRNELLAASEQALGPSTSVGDGEPLLTQYHSFTSTTSTTSSNVNAAYHLTGSTRNSNNSSNNTKGNNNTDKSNIQQNPGDDSVTARGAGARGANPRGPVLSARGRAYNDFNYVGNYKPQLSKEDSARALNPGVRVPAQHRERDKYLVLLDRELRSNALRIVEFGKHVEEMRKEVAEARKQAREECAKELLELRTEVCELVAPPLRWLM